MTYTSPRDTPAIRQGRDWPAKYGASGPDMGSVIFPSRQHPGCVLPPQLRHAMYSAMGFRDMAHSNFTCRCSLRSNVATTTVRQTDHEHCVWSPVNCPAIRLDPPYLLYELGIVRVSQCPDHAELASSWICLHFYFHSSRQSVPQLNKGSRRINRVDALMLRLAMHGTHRPGHLHCTRP